MNERTTTYHAKALSRGIELLRCIGRSGSIGLDGIYREIAVPKSSLIRLLTVLEEERLITRDVDDASYSLGYGIAVLAEYYVQHADLCELASPYLRKLSDLSGCTANLGILDGENVRHLCVEEPDRPLRYRSTTGSHDYAYCTGLGKALLASLSESELLRRLPPEPMEAFTPNTITTHEALMHELDRVRTDGYAHDDEERDIGVRCLAVLLPAGKDGAPRREASISVAGPAGELVGNTRLNVVKALEVTATEMAADKQLVSVLSPGQLVTR